MTPPQQSSAPGRRRAIIFDIDGTLVDSWRLGYDATQVVLKNNDIAPITPEIYHQCTRYATPDRLARHAGLDPSSTEFRSVGDKLAVEFDNLYVGLVSPSTAALFPGMEELVHSLAKDVTLGVLTNACVKYAERVLEIHAWEKVFLSVRGADNVPRPKPEADGLLICCGEMEVGPAECVYVGDSPSDALAARNAGMASIGVLWGSHSKESLMQAPFDHLCATVDELKKLLLQV
eukprot:CAMPEP_0172507916 /NCGR_PEP_ID=MMETSP1066-20121228/207649_1 /TAXON_ID=671091 /ORGANISM="Coscinodiscus wailesii, Strain CCMP2513" /LENGTH=232 /DNA_ID=CAMNT_0013285649 /DNA_START=135 /DNA_END=833 /DNA_ORIENTATION=+